MARANQYEKQIEELTNAIFLLESFIVEKKLEQEFDDFLKAFIQERDDIEIFIREILARGEN